MPRIREYTNQQTLNSGSLESAAGNAEQQGYYRGQAISGSFHDVAQGIGEFGEAYGRSRAMDRAKEFSDGDLQLTATYEQAKADGEMDDPEFATKFTEKHIAPLLEKIQSNVQTPQEQDVVDRMSMTLKSDYIKRAYADQINYHTEKVGADWEAGKQADLNSIALDPASVGSRAELARQAAMTAFPNDPLKREKLLTPRLKDLYTTSAYGLLGQVLANPNHTTNDVANVLKIVEDPKNGYTETIDLQAFQEKVATVKDTTGSVDYEVAKGELGTLGDALARGSSDADAAFQRDLVTMQKNAKTPSQIAEVIDKQREYEQKKAAGGMYQGLVQKYGDPYTNPDSAKRAEADIDTQIVAQNDALASAKSPTEIAQIKGRIEALKSTREVLSSAWSKNNAAFDADPAAYSMTTDPVVAQRAADYAKNPSPQTWAAYSQAQKVAQRNVRPGQTPQLLPQGDRDKISAAIQSITSDPTNGTANAAAVLQQYAKVTGSDWANVARELHSAHVLNDAQYVAATLYAKPQAQHLAEQLLRASVMSDENLQALGGPWYSAAREAAVSEFQSLRQSLGDQGIIGDELMAANVNAVAKLLQLRGGARDDVAQAHDLANLVINDEYDFVGCNGYTTLRIPKGAGDPSMIQSGTEEIMKGLDKRDIVVPPSNSGLNDQDQRAVYIDRVKHTGVWYATGDGKGAYLYDIDGGTPVMVKTKTGTQPLTHSWQYLAQQGVTANQTPANQSISTYENVVGR